MRRRWLSLLAASLLLLMLIGSAGHALHHLQHREACADCPVCLQLSSWRGLLARLGLLLCLMLYLHAGARRLRPACRRPFLRACTPVSLKVKMTN